MSLTSASSDVIPLVRSQSARKRMTNYVRGAPPESRPRLFRNIFTGGTDFFYDVPCTHGRIAQPQRLKISPKVDRLQTI